MEELKILALLLALLGIMDLIFLLFYLPIQEINSPASLQSLEDNTKVQTTGKVIDERIYSSNSVLILDNNLTLLINSKKDYKNKIIEATGKIDRYNHETNILVISIKEIIN